MANTFAKGKALLAGCVRGLIEAHTRRLEHEREFYRNLRAYCRANNLSPVCEDDWKTAAYCRDDKDPSDRSLTHPMIQAKGNVPWTKLNLPR